MAQHTLITVRARMITYYTFNITITAIWAYSNVLPCAHVVVLKVPAGSRPSLVARCHVLYDLAELVTLFCEGPDVANFDTLLQGMLSPSTAQIKC